MTKENNLDKSTNRRTYLKLTGIAAGFGMFARSFLGRAAAEPYTDSGSPHELPGRIQAEDFNEGGAGVAYRDTNSTNEGDVYRPNEGVDIQLADDESSEYNIGWIRDDEWLTYTISIPEGTYNVNLRVATDSSNGGDIRVLLDGRELGIASVTDTGGWQSWETITISDVNVSAIDPGVLRIEFATSAQFTSNFNWIEFVEPDMDSGSNSNSKSTEAITPKNLNNELYAKAFSGSDLSAKVQAALDALPSGQGRIRITARDDGQPWQWNNDLTIDITHTGFDLDIDRTVSIDYTGTGWPLTLEGESDPHHQARIAGGLWTATGDPTGWLRLKDCFGTEVYPTKIDFRNSSVDAVGVSLENHNGWTESSKIGGSYTCDIGIDSKPAELTGGTGTHSFHDTVLDNPKINAYNIGIRFRGWWQYCHIEKPVVWTKADGTVCYLLAAERMDGTTITSMKAEDPGSGSQDTIGIETADPFQGFWYGPTIIGGHIDVPGGDKVADNASDTGPAIQIRTHQKSFQVVDLKTGNTAELNPNE